MDTQNPFAALGLAMTDAQARDRFLADPRGFLEAAGLVLPESVTVSAREGETAELTITLPGLLDRNDADLSDESLAMASGGWFGGSWDAERHQQWVDQNKPPSYPG